MNGNYNVAPSFAETRPKTIFNHSFVKTKAWSINVKHYRDLGYNVNHGDWFYCSILHLKSNQKVDVTCPLCGIPRNVSFAVINRAGHTYCQGCANTRNYSVLNVESGIKFIFPVKNDAYNWVCKCGQCGNIFVSRANCIIDGLVVSCGCFGAKRRIQSIKDYHNNIRKLPRQNNPKFVDITGDLYGKLYVIKYHGLNQHKQSMWMCQCECGNQSIVSTNSIRSGSIKTCGCGSRGVGHYNYNPNLTDEERQAHRDNNGEYKKWKAVIKERDKQCIICGSNKKLNSHHVFSYKKYIDLRTSVQNGISLCQKHHIEFHQSYLGGVGVLCKPSDFVRFVFDKHNNEYDRIMKYMKTKKIFINDILAKHLNER